MNSDSNLVNYQGSCHCHVITFEIKAPEILEVDECNCSICKKTGFLHLILPKSHFRLLTGNEYLTDYQFNTHTAHHTFCGICGIKPFYIPRSNPDGIDVNVRCLDPIPKNIIVTPFDGINWEQNAASLKTKSKE